jgi:hypothetical protein
MIYTVALKIAIPVLTGRVSFERDAAPGKQEVRKQGSRKQASRG